VSHPYSLALALFFATRLYLFRQERHAAQEQAEELLTLAQEQEFAQWLAEATLLRDGILARQESSTTSLTQMRQHLIAYQATEGKLGVPWYLAFLAETYANRQQQDEGLNILAEALTIVGHTGERWWEAELYRLKGELLRQKTKEKGQKAKMEAEAEACFHQALTIARQQQAKSLELRAAMSLSRLWQEHGKGEAAYPLLAEIYVWFTEGGETVDLQEAKTLLNAFG
jgi:predicted ATPase